MVLNADSKLHKMISSFLLNDLSFVFCGIKTNTFFCMNYHSLATLMQTLRALDQLQVMEVFSVKQTVSPLALAKIEKERRQRARGNKE